METLHTYKKMVMNKIVGIVCIFLFALMVSYWKLIRLLTRYIFQ